MKKFTTIRTHHIKRPAYKAILCFLANEDYRQGDIKKNKNCSAALCWMVFPVKMDQIISQCHHIDLVCDLEVIRFKKDAQFRIRELLQMTSAEVVQDMVTTVERFIRETIKSKYD